MRRCLHGRCQLHAAILAYRRLGQIGSTACAYWSPAAPATSAAWSPRSCCATGHEVVVVDDLSTGHADAVPAGRGVPPAARSPRCDGRARRLGDRRRDPLRGQVAGRRVDRRSPALYWRNNVVGHGGAARLDARLRRRPHRVLVLGRDLRRGRRAADHRGRAGAADQPYGATKLAIDLALDRLRARATGWPRSACATSTSPARCTPVDGLSYGERHATETHLIPNALRAAAGPRRAAAVCSAPTTRPRTAPACATTSTSSISAEAHLRGARRRRAGQAPRRQPRQRHGYSVREVLDAVRRGDRARGARRRGAAPRR